MCFIFTPKQQVGQVAHPGETVIVQPMGVSTMNSAPIAGCPPGMEYMASLDKVSIFQVVHLSEGKEVFKLFKILACLQALFPSNICRSAWR